MEKKRKIERFIDKVYDNVIVSFSGGKDSVATLIYALNHFSKDKVKVLWVDLIWDFPELYPYIIYISEVLDVEINAVRIPVDFKDLALIFGFPHHAKRWCTMYGKIEAINYKLKEYPNSVSLDGTRWVESEARSTRTPFTSESDSFTVTPTYRPILDYSDVDVCNVALYHEPTLSLCSSYRYFDRLGCFMCPEMSSKEFFKLKVFYPNLFDRFIDLLGIASKNKEWRTLYMERELERIFKYKHDGDINDLLPYTRHYVNVKLIEDVVGIKIEDIRDDPDFKFKNALKEANVQPRINYEVAKPSDYLKGLIAESNTPQDSDSDG